MGVYLSTPKTDKTSEDGENEKMRYGVSSMQGWRTSMEDAHAALLDLDNSTSFFGVYDGHGGQAVSKFCAKFLHQQVIKHEAYSAGDIGTAAQKSFLRMDEMMCGQRGWRELAILGNKMDQFSGMIEGLIWSPRSGNLKALEDNWSPEEGPHSNYDGPTCGSTACVAIIHNNQLVVANAGDSRCVLSRKGEGMFGRSEWNAKKENHEQCRRLAYNLSKDHKPDLEVEKERIYKAGGYIQFGRVNGSLNLSRAIGDMELKRDKTLPPEKQILTANPDINSVELCDDDDFLVLACDGIWDCMSSQQLVDFVSEQLKTESKLSAVCEKVFDRCLAPVSGGEGCDNMTMILVQFKKPESGSSTSQPLDSSNDQEVPESD
nr:probable protein phosphatase 2C 60 [Tanacetum cinerariifolium]